MRTIDILLEEQSAEVVLKRLLPHYPNVRFKLITHQGKGDLLRKLPNKLRAYRSIVCDNYRVVVLLDRDKEDCNVLKMQLEEMFKRENISTKTHPSQSGDYFGVTRISIEELESWYFGDIDAITSTFPQMGRHIPRKYFSTPPDHLQDPSGQLESLLKKAGYKIGGKIDLARKMSQNMYYNSNRSVSYLKFMKAIDLLAT